MTNRKIHLLRVAIFATCLSLCLTEKAWSAQALPVRADNPSDLGVVVGPGTVKLVNGKAVPVAETHLTFDPPELREVSIDCKAPKAYADRFSQWDPWPDAQFDPVPEARKIPNAINLCPQHDDQGTLILGGLYRAFVPESVVVTTADGSRTFVKGEDWVYNRNGAQVGNFEGRLGTPGEAPLKISAKYALQRIDLVQMDASGNISVKKGVSEMLCPALPEADADHVALAGIYLAAWNAASNPWYDGQKGGLSAKTDYAISEHEIFPINPAPPVEPINKAAVAHSLQKLKDGKELKIAFVGASVTVGAETPAWWDHLWTDQNLGFPSVVVTGLRKQFPKATVTPIMASQGGTTAKYGLEMIDKVVIPAKPDVVLIDFGGNDANGAIGAPPNNPPDQFKDDMRTIIKKSKDAGAEVIIVIGVGYNWGAPWKVGKDGDRRPVYRQIMLDLAKEENVAAVDVTTEMANLATHGIPSSSQLHSAHPGILGHKVYADVILRLFE